MKLGNLVGERFKERPSDCVIDSHALMVRGAYIKFVASGIYSSFAPLKRIFHKIEAIVREEMDKIDGQEVSLPVVLPASLWEASGRCASVGQELVRFADRNKAPYLLGMTHEEAAVQLVRESALSYTAYPFMIYQIQTKFRDEARPRAGLIRVREFTMKDAYSFHTSQKDLDRFYGKCYQAYQKIYERVGLPEVIAVASGAGIMGGDISHEFMLLSAAGEDSIVICQSCQYKANMEVAENIVENQKDELSYPLTQVYTPDVQTIDDLCSFFETTPDRLCKAVAYRKESDQGIVVLLLRGDYEVNEAKLKSKLGCEIRPAEIDDKSGLAAGYIGPYQLNASSDVFFDRSLENTCNLICGANKANYHYSGLDISRDIGDIGYIDVAKAVDGGICPGCGSHLLSVSRGIELGNIFQLGTKYTRSMGMTYLDENGQQQYPIMGCYGIGIGRLAACVCEARHDAFGPIWPMAIAPWQVHLCAVRADNIEVKTLADRIYSELTNRSIEVIYDDRKVSAGVMFSDADLLGVPLRVIISPRNIKENKCEVVSRDKTLSLKIDMDQCVETVIGYVRNGE